MRLSCRILSLIHFFSHYSRGRPVIDDASSSSAYQVSSLVSYSKGFACAFGLGTVYLFEKTDDKEFFKKAREIMVINFFKIPKGWLKCQNEKIKKIFNISKVIYIPITCILSYNRMR